MGSKSDLLLIDGRHLLYRVTDAFGGLGVEVDGDIYPTGGIYGFLNVSIRIHQVYGGKVVVAWEGDHRNFRLDLMPSYKGRDQPMDEAKVEFISEMGAQEVWLKHILRSAGIRQYLGVNCEADDVLGSLATKVAGRGKRVFIYSGDSDLRQLVCEREDGGGIWTVSPGMRRQGDKIYGPAEVVDKHGVTPELISDLKALSGDNSDNIPGVKGIGPKTAAALLNEFGGLGEVIEAAHNEGGTWPVAERFRAPILSSIPELRLYHQLTNIKMDCEMELIEPARRQADVVEQLKRFKFRSLAGPAELHQLMRMG